MNKKIEDINFDMVGRYEVLDILKGCGVDE